MPAEDPGRRRVVVADDGPVLVEGPVEIDLPDGSSVLADRPVVAVCTCRRSSIYPLCDTSHRGRRRRRKENP
ncbi:CDGSH iron-sulfur domain-containing protein [Auraticoccus sp. F435]|uniref:CDGSH iron-sulfur domain-containing protein n=1 Tax=Auraticoccus cholistanensis TaxID=2656650 RepID=A0A6A9UZ11_9ACTN|nr:CDGSH iron-sulfur domain-containing protein [Auraticoccus cholistanensis]